MVLLVAGLLLFAAVHFVPSLAPGLKKVWLGRLGENGYKGTFSLLLLAALALMVFGWRGTPPTHVFLPPDALHYPALALIYLGFLLFVVSNRKSRLRRIVRHPQLTGVALWGIAHLMLNGDNRSLLLFGGLTLWAVGEIIAINRRDEAPALEEAPGLGTEIVTVAITAVVIGVVIAIHPWLSGRAVW
jgi:uncharacterized membrane protein